MIHYQKEVKGAMTIEMLWGLLNGDEPYLLSSVIYYSGSDFDSVEKEGDVYILKSATRRITITATTVVNAKVVRIINS